MVKEEILNYFSRYWISLIIKWEAMFQPLSVSNQLLRTLVSFRREFRHVYNPHLISKMLSNTRLVISFLFFTFFFVFSKTIWLKSASLCLNCCWHEQKKFKIHFELILCSWKVEKINLIKISYFFRNNTHMPGYEKFNLSINSWRRPPIQSLTSKQRPATNKWFIQK